VEKGRGSQIFRTSFVEYYFVLNKLGYRNETLIKDFILDHIPFCSTLELGCIVPHLEQTVALVAP